jgi:ssDNA-binding Zn-finger/Zn-ribbon topoisomerase 1
MDINIRLQIGRCHECGHEYVILSRKVEHPKELKVPAIARCPECDAAQTVVLSSKKQLTSIPDENLEKLSEILLQDDNCAKCSKALPLLSGERVDLVFKMQKVINEDEGFVEEWTLSVPFCQHCKENETEESLVIASQKYLAAEEEGGSPELLRNAARSWKY